LNCVFFRSNAAIDSQILKLRYTPIGEPLPQFQIKQQDFDQILHFFADALRVFDELAIAVF